jgi:hypothetical protein
LYPVPPKISLPIKHPKLVATASIHKGTVGGIVSGIKKPVTKNPSLISCPLISANKASNNPPTVNTTKYIGRTIFKPYKKHAIKSLLITSGDCNPTLYIPKKNAGRSAKTTKIIVRFKSIASLTYGACSAFLFVVYKKVSSASCSG